MIHFEWLQNLYFITLVRWLLGIMFLASGISKLFDQRDFVDIVLAYKLLPKRLSRLFAFCLPWFEISVGIALLLGLATTVGAIIGGVLLLSFTIAVGINLARGRRELDCGCFGSRRMQKINGKILIRNIFLTILSIYVAFFANGYLALDGLLFSMQEPNKGRDMPSPEGLLLTILAITGLLMIYLLIRYAKAFSQNDYS